MDAIDCYDTLRTFQARFDDRQADYTQKLAEFQRSEANDDDTRIQFDHQHIQHVRRLTKDLISAEQEYRAAKAKARALELPADPGGFNSSTGYRTNDSNWTSGNVSFMSNNDRERIEAWAHGVLPKHDAEIPENTEPSDLDDWNARPVEIMDSISVIDRHEYVDEIDDWKKHCSVLRAEASIDLGRKTNGL